MMYFYDRKNGNQPDIIVNGERIQTVSHFNYLGITVDSQLSFKKHVKQVCNRVKFNLRNQEPTPSRCSKPLHAHDLSPMYWVKDHVLQAVLQAGHKLEKQHLLHCKHFSNKHSKYWTKSHQDITTVT